MSPISEERAHRSTEDYVRSLEQRVEEAERENALLRVQLSLASQPPFDLAELDDDLTLAQKQVIENQQTLSNLLDILRESEKRFRQLADSMPQLVWTARPDGVVDYYNMRHNEYDGIIQTQEQGWDWRPVVHPNDLEATRAAWQHALQTGEVYQIEHRVRMRGGRFAWHLSRGVPVSGPDGQIGKWYGTATNIHDLKMAEEALKDYADRLEHSNQELQQFAFVASHDLQEPLRKIRSFGSVLNRRLQQQLDEESREFLTRMIDSAERMQTMITGLLELSRIHTTGSNFEPVDLNKLLPEVLSDLEGRILMTGGQVTVGPLPTIEADPQQIRRLFLNLIGNALKFHKRGEKPVVNVSAVCPSSTDTQPSAVIEVSDQGVGFDESQAERLFQPFQRLNGRSEYEGTGIGLTICQRIVERHHGAIRARSEPGKGSTFTVILPLRQE